VSERKSEGREGERGGREEKKEKERDERKERERKMRGEREREKTVLNMEVELSLSVDGKKNDFFLFLLLSTHMYI